MQYWIITVQILVICDGANIKRAYQSGTLSHGPFNLFLFNNTESVVKGSVSPDNNTISSEANCKISNE